MKKLLSVLVLAFAAASVSNAAVVVVQSNYHKQAVVVVKDKKHKQAVVVKKIKHKQQQRQAQRVVYYYR